MLNEGQLAAERKEKIEEKGLRGIEMIRHLPIAVEQFDCKGEVMEQNPEALKLFGPGDQNSFIKKNVLSRFVDQELGKDVLRKVVEDGQDYEVEAQQHTTRGSLWFAVKARRSRDPVSGEPVILYSARDITELVQAKKEAEKANIAKSEFIAVMAHEIRTPLHQVNGFIELLNRTSLDAKQTEYSTHLEQSSMHLMTVINDLLDFTKLELGKMKLESIPFEVRDVVSGAVAVISPKAIQKGLEVVVHPIPGSIPLKVSGDPTRLRQVLHNLLHNAVEFTHKGGIYVTVSSDSGDNSGKAIIEFSVVDSGIGLNEQYCDTIFEKYQQGGTGVSRKYGGTGLGLAICKALVISMNGSIGVESEVGSGSRFWFRIPFDLPVAVSRTQETETLEMVKQDQPSLRILVAEDNQVNQQLVLAMLKRMGHNVMFANNGCEAVEKIEEGEFDLILMDVQMPKMDGYEATRAIRSMGWTATVLPIIGLTASFRTADIGKYREVGMNDCLCKPLSMDNLSRAIQRISNTKDSMQSLEGAKDMTQRRLAKQCTEFSKPRKGRKVRAHD